MKLAFSPEAEADLESIGDWIASSNPSRAASFVAELRAACAGLAIHPRRFERIARLQARDLRRRVHDQYLIVYEVRSDDIVIVRVVHGAMDPDAMLSDLDS